MGIMIPLTIKKPVVSHCTVEVLISKAFIKVGKAVVKMVWFKTVQNEPIKSTRINKDRL